MKILHINSYYAHSKFYKSLYDEQIRQGIDISVFVPAANDFDNNANCYGDYTIISKCFNKYDRIVFHMKHAKILHSIRKSFSINDFDVIHAHSLFSNGYIAYKLNQEFGIPYVVAVRNTDVNVFFKRAFYLRNTGIEILKNSRKIVFLSESYKTSVLEKYIPDDIKADMLKKIEIIPNGIDEFWFRNKSMFPKDIESNLIKLLYIGDVNDNKNLLTTLEAIDLLIRDGLNITYDVVGKVIDRSIYDEIQKRSYARYYPPVSKEELIEFYRNNDIFIMPSKTETFGLVYAEAMSQGLPVIYSKGQGFDGQFADGKIGYGVISKDAKDIASKILQVVNDYDALSENCLQSVEKFKWTKIERQYMGMCDEVISNQSVENNNRI